MLFVGFSLILLGGVWILVSEMVLDLAKKKWSNRMEPRES